MHQDNNHNKHTKHNKPMNYPKPSCPNIVA